MLKDDFPRIWVPSWENRDLRPLLWHRHRMVQMRTPVMNQLQVVALNEGVRRKKALWRPTGRIQLESLVLAPWASRHRQDLLELLDRLNPTIAELTKAVEEEVEKCPEAQRLMTHPGGWSSDSASLRAGYRNGGAVLTAPNRSRAIWDWYRRRSPVGIVDGWDISANKATLCVSRWWKRHKSRCAVTRNGAASFSIWRCDEDGRAPR
jgi:hypothetical protein